MKQREAMWLGLAVTGVIAAACGGIAIIDADGSGGTGATGTAATGGGTSPVTTTGPDTDLCEVCALADIAVGTVKNAELTEISGIAPSKVHQDTYYVHNDSGGAPRFFAINSAGLDLGSFVVNQAAAVDWEDIATGPCTPGGVDMCVFIGDIGDNLETRGTYTIYRVTEPATFPGGGASIAGTAFTFMYPDGSHNAETLLVDPASGAVYIVTKSEGSSSIYRFSTLSPDGNVPEKVGEINVPTGVSLITGGDASDRGVLLRTYTNVFLYDRGTDVASHLTGPGCAVTAPSELQGEAIGWGPRDGESVSYLTVAEGDFPSVYGMRCQLP